LCRSSSSLGLALALVNAPHPDRPGGWFAPRCSSPTAIVTVVASLQAGITRGTPGTGYLANLLPQGQCAADPTDPVAGQSSSSPRVWKTTPFMSLLLAGRPGAWWPEDLLKAAQGPMAPAAWGATDQDHVADHQTGGPCGRAVVPDPGRFPAFSTNIYVLTEGNKQHRLGVDPGYDNLFEGFRRRPRLGDQRAGLCLRGRHRARLHQGVRRRGAGRW